MSECPPVEQAGGRIETKGTRQAEALDFGKLNPGLSIRCSLPLAATQPALNRGFTVLLNGQSVSVAVRDVFEKSGEQSDIS
jgi:hypothetical protein